MSSSHGDLCMCYTLYLVHYTLYIMYYVSLSYYILYNLYVSILLQNICICKFLKVKLLELKVIPWPKLELITNVPPPLPSGLMFPDSWVLPSGPKHLLFYHAVNHGVIQKDQLFRVPGLLYSQKNPKSCFLLSCKVITVSALLFVSSPETVLSICFH